MKEVAEFADYVTAWRVAGPYSVKGQRGQQIFDVVFAPEKPGATDIEWKDQPIHKSPERYWFIDLDWSLGGDNCAGYLRTYVWSPTEQPVRLELGSDDALKVWVNDAEVHANNVPRGCGRGQDKVVTTLRPGWNQVLLKVIDFGGGWAASMRVRGPNGERLDGLKFDADAKP